MKTAALAALVTLAALVGCRGSTLGIDRSVVSGAPSDGETVDDVPVRGAEVSLSANADGATDSLSGELLAVEETHIWVETSNGLVAIERATITAIDVELHASGALALGIWTAAGTLSSISHGLLLLLSAPTWLAGGISATAHAALTNDAKVGLRDIRRLRQYARFPGGLPPAWRRDYERIGVDPPRFTPTPDAPRLPTPKPAAPGTKQPATTQPATTQPAPSTAPDEPGMSE